MRRLAGLKSIEQFMAYADELGLHLPCDAQLDAPGASPLAQPLQVSGRTIGNRFCVLPMEGWDGTRDGRPSEHTRRRWRRFGLSGAKLIWGGEAVAVRQDGRANPRQLLIHAGTVSSLADLRAELEQAHLDAVGRTDDLCIGLQLTHSGRFARPHDSSRPEPLTLYRHPILEQKFPTVGRLLNDDDIRQLVDDYVAAARLAHQAGFEFVDLKHCHGYLGHEFLSGVDRPGNYGGSFENRTRFLREVATKIRAAVPDLRLAVRVSMVDTIPFRAGPQGQGEPYPVPAGGYRFAFGGDPTGLAFDLTEPLKLLDLLRELGIELVCVSLGSPYYNPHAQRPAWHPPSDGYLPPDDPLIWVARHIDLVRQLKAARPEMIFVGSGYSYLQEFLPQVAQAAVRRGMVDSVGLGRMVLAYPELPADVLAGRPLQTRRLCRTFSDCTTAPRQGLISGCFPLDAYYKGLPEALELRQVKSPRKRAADSSGEP